MLDSRRSGSKTAALAFALIFGAFGGARAQYAGSQPVPTDLKPGWDTIMVDECKGFLQFLAGPETRGRGTGQPGFQKAADFVAAHFKQYGLKPVGDNGTYFQMAPFTRYRPKQGDQFLQKGDGARLTAGLEMQTIGDQADVTGNVVFVRAGANGEKLPDGTILEGKVAVVVCPKPTSALRRAISGANPAATLYVSANPNPATWGVSVGANANVPNRPAVGGISTELAKQIAAAVEVAPETVSDAPDGTVLVKDSGEAIKVHATREVEQVMVPNVVGLLEGSDPTLKAQLVGIGAHLDHLGDHNGLVYPGADDDGSGSTALLALAHALTSNPVKPKRSILFMNFCGEEMGLIGSGFYADHPIFPHDSMICELQMDMVGRNAENDTEHIPASIQMIHLVGSKRISTELDRAIQDANKFLNFTFSYSAEDVYTRSDHYNFAKHGIPIAFLFDGFHPDYHEPTDTVDKIDWAKLTNSAKLYYIVAMRSANRDVPYKKDVVAGTGGGRR